MSEVVGAIMSEEGDAIMSEVGDAIMSELVGDAIMSEEEMNSYRLTSMEEPGDERMAQIMREVAEEARESTHRAAERVAAGIEASSLEARAKVEETLNRLHNGVK